MLCNVIILHCEYVLKCDVILKEEKRTHRSLRWKLTNSVRVRWETVSGIDQNQKSHAYISADYFWETFVPRSADEPLISTSKVVKNKQIVSACNLWPLRLWRVIDSAGDQGLVWYCCLLCLEPSWLDSSLDCYVACSFNVYMVSQ